MKVYSIKKFFKFECSHRLYGLCYESPCKSIHGHSYEIWVEIFSSSLNDNKMVLDFTYLKSFQTWLDNNFDHAMIISKNDNELKMICDNTHQKYFIMDSNFTSAEAMAELFFNQINKIIIDLENKNICKNITKIKISVAETRGNIATYENLIDVG